MRVSQKHALAHTLSRVGASDLHTCNSAQFKEFPGKISKIRSRHIYIYSLQEMFALPKSSRYECHLLIKCTDKYMHVYTWSTRVTIISTTMKFYFSKETLMTGALWLKNEEIMFIGKIHFLQSKKEKPR